MTPPAKVLTLRRSFPGRPSGTHRPAAAGDRRLDRVIRLLGGGLAGGVLALLLTSCFSAPPQIISLEPNRGSTSVLADAPVRVVFDRPVTHSSIVGRFTVTAAVSPAIPGCDFSTVFSAPSTAACWIHWLDPEPGFELVHLGAVFRPATAYHFTLAGGFSDPQGDRNGLDHHWDLTTAPAPLLAASTPADHATDVAVDARLAVSFSAPMDAPTTAGAITLTPAVPGTRVVGNSLDKSRFVILPGQTMAPDVTYTIGVARTARGEDEQFLATAVALQFTTGEHMEGPHAVVLAGVQGERATEVLLPALAPAAAGEPIAAPVLLKAPRCAISTGCGALATGAALQTYAAAATSPDGTHVAVVVNDAQTSTSALEVIDTVYGAVIADIPDGTLPSWSRDGTRLALAAGAHIDVSDVRSGRLSVLAADTTVTAPPLWAANTTLVLSTAATAGVPAAVELVDQQVDAQYQLPGAPPASTAVAVSPGGGRIALATSGGGVVVTPAPGGPGSAQRLTGHLQAVGFAGEGVLLAVSTTVDGTQLVRISVVGGDTTTVTLGTGAPDLQSVRTAADGRRLVCLGVDPNGVRQAYVANADGTGELAMTRFTTGGLEAQAVAFSD
ncbi:MAG TPA: Ig-like domain-containing protein [Candidatus Dormibacteraeota bacterium]